MRLVKSALAVVLLMSALPAARANVVGVDAQNFNATTNGLDFVTVQSSSTLQPGIFNLGLFVNQAVNTLPVFTPRPGTPNVKRHHRDTVTGADVNLGVGLMRDWDLGISVPQVLRQTVSSDSLRGQFQQTGITEARLNSKVRVLGGNGHGGLALVGSLSQNLIENNPYTGVNPGLTETLELAADTSIDAVAMAINLGYRWRKPGEAIPEFPLAPFRNQYIYSAAVSYLLPGLDTKVIGEVFGSRPVKSVDFESDRAQSSAEALLGVKYDVTTNVALHVGAGTELINGVGSPDFRAYAGVNITFGPVFSEKSALVRKKQAKTKAEPDEEEELSALPVVPQTQPETIVIRDVLFAFDSSRDVLPGTVNSLKELVAYLRRPPAYKKLVIEGHTDSIGSDDYNQSLSDRRAAAIRLYLIKAYNLPEASITAAGFGESRPVADNGNYQGRQLNRRVEFKIYRK